MDPLPYFPFFILFFKIYFIFLIRRKNQVCDETCGRGKVKHPTENKQKPSRKNIMYVSVNTEAEGTFRSGATFDLKHKDKKQKQPKKECFSGRKVRSQYGNVFLSTPT